MSAQRFETYYSGRDVTFSINGYVVNSLQSFGSSQPRSARVIHGIADEPQAIISGNKRYVGAFTLLLDDVVVNTALRILDYFTIHIDAAFENEEEHKRGISDTYHECVLDNGGSERTSTSASQREVSYSFVAMRRTFNPLF